MNYDSKHINSAFDEDLDRLLTQVMTLGGLVEDSIQQSTQALLTRDNELAEQVIQSDARIDMLHEDIHMAAVNIIALRQPQARDLRMVIAVMRISTILERVGDCSKNTAKRTSAIVQTPPLGSAVGSVGRLAKASLILLKDSLDAFIQLDERKARDVIRRDHEIDQMYSSLFREFLTYMLEFPNTITSAMHFLFITKNIERIGDHATGVSEQTIYFITGLLPEGERKKSDDAAYFLSPDASDNERTAS